jgi:uncharacterized membrane protein YdfJ with MMPL/SSD domain
VWGLLLWLVIVASLTGAVTVFGAQTSNDTSLPGTQSQDAINVLAADFPPSENGTSPIVFQVRTGTTVNTAANKTAITDAVAAIKKVDGVHSATSPYGNASAYLVSKDQRIAYTPVLMDISSADLSERDARRVLVAAERATKGTGITVAAGGTIGAALSNPNTDASTVIGLIAAVIILAVSFGSLIAMFMPIISAILGLALGLAVIGLLGHVLTVPSVAPTLATMIGLGVGIDYALFVVSRHREEMAKGVDPKEAAALAVGTAGMAVVFAGATLIFALLALGVAGIPLISSLGYASCLAVLTAVLSAVTLMPAVLSLLGHRLNSLRIFGRHRAAGAAAAGPGLAERWGRFVARHPWPMVVLGVAILVPLSLPLFAMDLGQEDIGVSQPSTQRTAYDLMTTGFGVGYNGPLLVAVTLDPPAQEDPAVAAQINEANALKAQLEAEQAQGQAEQAQLEQEAAEAQAEANRLKAERADLDAQAAALARQRSQLAARAAALRQQAVGQRRGREAALAAQVAAAVTDLQAARARVREVDTAITRAQAERAAIDAQIAGSVDPAVLAILTRRRDDLQRRIDALVVARDPAAQAQAAADARAAALRAQLQAALAVPRTPAQQALLVQAEGIVAQARVLAGKRASLIRQREALLRRESALLAQVASIERQKQQLLALQAEAEQQQAQAEALQAQITAELTAVGGNPLGTDPRLEALQKALTDTKGVASVLPPSINEKGTAATYNAIPTTAPAAPATADLVRTVRDQVVPPLEKTEKGLTAYVGGTTAGNIDLASEITDTLPLVILTVVLLNVLVLLVAFRSILVPIQAGLVIMGFALASLGVLTVVFQFGWGFDAVGLDATNACCTWDGRPSDPIASYVPLMMYAALFGLANDYQVFLLSRVEADPAGTNPRKAVADGLASSTRVILTAALIMLSVFASFILNGDPVIKQFGVGLSTAVLLAGGMTLFLVPAILALLGRHAFWFPRWLGRIVPRVDIEGRKVEEQAAAKGPGDTPAV